MVNSDCKTGTGSFSDLEILSFILSLNLKS